MGDLVDAFFGAHRGLASAIEEGFVPLDEGLVILSRHARSLGYDAVILFLDELVLWLASHAADMAFVNRERQKVAKLVEAAHMDRALPIVSFIARQRDLRELVGEHMPGAQQLNFADNLSWKLIPLLEEQHGVTLADIESGGASADTARAFRNDARLVKTLILSSLAEGVEALKALTPARLAALNHGTVRSPIPGMESQMVLTRVRSWAARVGEIKVSDDARNPAISLHLVGVDTEGILENAKSFDNCGNRIQKVRRLLYEMLEIEGDESFLPPRHEIVWKGTKRACEILFRNVRELPLDNFEPQDARWRIVIDYPFDLPTFSPRDDFAKVQEYLGHKPPANTLVWLPGFLTPEALDELGRLVVLDHVLMGKKLDEYGAHLSQLDRDQARVILVNQRDQVRQRVRNFLLLRIKHC